jgi:hypothetical protein
VKKIDFTTPSSSNGDLKAIPLVGLPELPPLEVAEKTDAPVEGEADEPILKENPNRFVLFPIKYHEVRDFDASNTRFTRNLHA